MGFYINKEKFDEAYTESNVFKHIAKILFSEAAPPCTLTYEVRDDKKTDKRSVVFEVKQRGTWKDDKGIAHPSLFVTCLGNGLANLAQGKYKKVRLDCVHAESNNYKAYIMSQNVDGTIRADYGSIDEVDKGNFKTVKDPYPSYMYWIRYYEKLSKGYIDNTRLYGDANAKKAAAKVIDDKSVNAILYKRLMEYAHKVVDANLANPHNITVKRANAARKIWKTMGERKTVAGFNRQLEKLIAISPRKRNPLVDNVKNFMASSKADFPGIINREDSLISAMEAVAGCDGAVKKGMQSFKNFDIHVWEATDVQKTEVMDMLDPSLKSKVVKIYRVKPREQEKKFSKYVKDNHIHKIKKFWHGSGNENWASIIENGLKLNPNAQITGKMFGHGIYFAPSSHKSWNYTSCKGTSWRHGSSDRGFMGLYATAYGDPLLVSGAGQYTKSDLDRAHKNCVLAESARTGLRADEVVFYDENAICLNYIVEFAA